MILFFVIVLLCSAERSSAQCKYAKYTPDHTFCKPPNKSCALLSKGVSAADKNTILKAHNTFRNRVAMGLETRGSQPKAANMMELKWDDSLAEVAQKFAEQCVFAHDCNQCRRVDNYANVGQNLYTAMGTGDMPVNWNNAVSSWYDEVKDFNRNGVDKYKFDSKTGHYTQVVWAETKAVGCGYSKYRGSKWPYQQLYVCNYGPGGNFIGQPIYIRGNPQSRCSSKRSATYPGLCL